MVTAVVRESFFALTGRETPRHPSLVVEQYVRTGAIQGFSQAPFLSSFVQCPAGQHRCGAGSFVGACEYCLRAVRDRDCFGAASLHGGKSIPHIQSHRCVKANNDYRNAWTSDRRLYPVRAFRIPGAEYQRPMFDSDRQQALPRCSEWCNGPGRLEGMRRLRGHWPS